MTGNVPVPDPTLLTTSQLYREISAVRTAARSWVDQLQLLLESRQARVEQSVLSLERLHSEKFSSIATQFAERDVRTEQTARDVKIAVDAALQAAKEASGEQNKSFVLATSKSEAATTKQIDAQGLAIQTAYNGLNAMIVDLKDRLTRLESVGATVDKRSDSQRGDNANVIAIVAISVGVLIAVGGWFAHAIH